MVVRILVSDTVAECRRPLVVRVAQMRRHLTDRAVANILAGVPDRERGPVALRCRRQVDRCLGQVQLGLRQTDVFERVRGCDRDLQRLLSARPTSSEAKITMRRAMKRASSPASSIRASQ